MKTTQFIYVYALKIWATQKYSFEKIMILSMEKQLVDTNWNTEK